ncbi:hypothetical protein F5Y09DRAFT_338824 [Xylaria sp. FL1042]|nr:hypothetical protein F5Y09DRAFT_338824 [Xylaria sp. FL1042]
MAVIQSLSLKVSNENPDCSLEQLGSESQRYKTTRAIIDRGLQLFERSDMREWLVLTARETVIGFRGSELESLWPLGQRRDTTLPEMPSFIDSFLQELRREFLEIRLSRNLKGEAAVTREEWAVEQVSPTVHSWRSRYLGYMILSGDIINCMVSTRNLATWRSFMFQMTVSVAHEVAHLLTAVLSSGKIRSTPKKMKTGSCEGEAGFFFEMKAFGGIAEFYASISRPDDTQQPGIPYMIKGTGLKDLGVELSEETIQEFVEDINNVNLPLIPDDIGSLPGVTTREEIQKNTAGLVMSLRNNSAEVP